MIALDYFSKEELYRFFTDGWKENTAIYATGFTKRIGSCNVDISPAGDPHLYRVSIWKHGHMLIDANVCRGSDSDKGYYILLNAIKNVVRKLSWVKKEDAEAMCCSDSL